MLHSKLVATSGYPVRRSRVRTPAPGRTGFTRLRCSGRHWRRHCLHSCPRW